MAACRSGSAWSGWSKAHWTRSRLQGSVWQKLRSWSVFLPPGRSESWQVAEQVMKTLQTPYCLGPLALPPHHPASDWSRLAGLPPPSHRQPLLPSRSGPFKAPLLGASETKLDGNTSSVSFRFCSSEKAT